MNSSIKNNNLINNLFKVTEANFTALALEIFQFQYEHNLVYHQYCKALQVEPSAVDALEKIPFLPIAFFKTHTIATTPFEPAAIFESSGTTQTINSKHWVKDLSLYEQSFNAAFRLFYGEPSDWCILALLPSYLERNNSSLVMMAEHLIKQSGHAQSGFYLDDFEQLNATLMQLERQQQKTLLIGVTFALLDFAEQFAPTLQYTTVMETGGMKGRRQELTREAVHQILCNQFNTDKIHSEYFLPSLSSTK